MGRVSHRPLGWFVVRPSSKPGCWALTVQEGRRMHMDGVVSVLITRENGESIPS